MRLVIAAVALTLSACAGNPTPANADLQQAARLNTQLGIDYMRQGQYEVALEKLQRALEQDRDYATAHSAIAFAYQQRGEFKLAEKHYRRALDLDSGNPESMNNFGVFLCGQGRAWDAEEYLLKAAKDKRYATPEVAWTNAGVCAKSYNYEKSEKYLREALRINPELPEALAQMALVSLRQKDYFRARGFLQRFEVAGRHTAETLWAGAQIERAMGDEIAARKYEIRLRRDFPDSEEAALMTKNLRNDS